MTGAPSDHPFAGPLAAMEAEIAASESRGEPVMPQAYAMVAKLRELMQALDGLEASLGTPPAAPHPDGPPPDDERTAD